MALSIDAVRRRLQQDKPQEDTVTKRPLFVTGGWGGYSGRSASTGSRVNKQPVESGTTVNKQPVANTGQPIRPAQPQTTTAMPHTSPVFGQADLPKYDNVDQFDFNRPYEDQLDQFQRQRADLQQQNDLETQRLQEEYGRIFRSIKDKQQEALNLDAERMAGQGILRSGLAVKSAGELGNEFGGELDQQQRALAADLENRTSSFAQADRQIQEQIGRAQEALTRQQQELEQQRARQAAAAEAAQWGADQNFAVAEKKKPIMNVVKDNLGKYFIVDAGAKTRQQVDQSQLGQLGQTNTINQISDLNSAGALFGGDYIKNANALARRLGGNLGGQATLDTRLGFRDIGKYGGH